MGSGRVEKLSSTYAVMKESLYKLGGDILVWLLLGIYLRVSIVVDRYGRGGLEFQPQYPLSAENWMSMAARILG